MVAANTAETSDNFGAKRRRRRRYRPMAEINVTPFVDVMLVLLIVFMVTAPLLTVGVPVELPKTEAKQLPAQKKEPLTITVDSVGGVFLQESQIEIQEVAAKLKAITNSGFEEEIYVRGDAKVNFGTVASVMGALNAAGFRRINLVTESQ